MFPLPFSSDSHKERRLGIWKVVGLYNFQTISLLYTRRVVIFLRQSSISRGPPPGGGKIDADELTCPEVGV